MSPEQTMLSICTSLVPQTAEQTTLQHLFAVFCEGFFERNRFQSPLIVRPDAILHFLSPQSIYCFVRLIEAGKKLINDEGFVGWRKTQCSFNDFLGFCSHESHLLRVRKDKLQAGGSEASCGARARLSQATSSVSSVSSGSLQKFLVILGRNNHRHGLAVSRHDFRFASGRFHAC